MSAKNLTRWTCDRCGSVKETDPERVPALWASVSTYFLYQPEGKPIHLCNPCEVSLRHYLKRDASWAMADYFLSLAMDYFDQPAGTAGNKERGDRARAALARLTDVETDMTPFYEAGFFLGDPKDWATDGSLTGVHPEETR